MSELIPVYRIETILASNNSRKSRGAPLRVFNRCETSRRNWLIQPAHCFIQRLCSSLQGCLFVAVRCISAVPRHDLATPGGHCAMLRHDFQTFCCHGKTFWRDGQSFRDFSRVIMPDGIT